ncbi:MAG: hypothetical protein AAF411_21395 [Myxococcota bacterium]
MSASRNALLARIGKAVAVSGIVLTLLAGALYGLHGLLGGAAGAALAYANWSAIAWLAERVSSQAVRSRGRLAILATLKTSLLMATCWIALTVVGLHSRAFIIGISALVAGILIGPLTMPEGESASTEAGESNG